MQLQFQKNPKYFFLQLQFPELILHDYSVEGYMSEKLGRRHLGGHDLVRRMDRQGSAMVQKMLGLSEAENGTPIDELLQARTSRHKRAGQDVETNSDSRRRYGSCRCRQNTHDTFVHVHLITEHSAQVQSLTTRTRVAQGQHGSGLRIVVSPKLFRHPSVMSHMLPHLSLNTSTRSHLPHLSSDLLPHCPAELKKPCEIHGGLADINLRLPQPKRPNPTSRNSPEHWDRSVSNTRKCGR